MPSFSDWLDRLFTTGEVDLTGPPGPDATPSTVGQLARAHARLRLDVAGPPLPFDAKTALAAAHWFAHACWCLVEQSEPGRELAPFGDPPTAHLSADVTLAFLPSVLHRARLAAADDALAVASAELLRRWPLSGVLADLDQPPTTPTDFDGHPGLQLLYAERLAAHARPSWLPPDGPTRDRYDLVTRVRS